MLSTPGRGGSRVLGTRLRLWSENTGWVQRSNRRPTSCRPFDHTLIVRETGFRMPDDKPDLGIQEIYTALAIDEARNRRIVDDVIAVIHEGRSPILLTERKDHLEYFTEQLRGFVRNLVVLQGGMTAVGFP
jgi:hypothetical protein